MNDFVLLAIARAQAKKLVSDSLKREIVTELPTQDIDTNTIYMILKTTPGQNDYYDEYMYINNQWEHIGSTEVDLTDYVKNTDYATLEKAGVVKIRTSDGLMMSSSGDGQLLVNASSPSQVKAGVNSYNPIVPNRQHESVFYGLAKAAGDTSQAASANAVGNYTDEAKEAIRGMIDVLPKSIIANSDTPIATSTHAVNTIFIIGENLYRATEEIAIGDQIIAGTNAEIVSLDDVFIKGTDYATSNATGVVKVYESGGTSIDSVGRISVAVATPNQIKSGNSGSRPVNAGHQHEAAFYGLAKAAGNTDQSTSANPVGTYTDDAKAKIATMLGIPNIVTLTQAAYDLLDPPDPDTYYFIEA